MRHPGLLSFVAVLGLVGVATAHAEPPPPQVSAPATVAPPFGWIDRRGDYHLRHAGLMAFGISADGSLAASGAIDGSVIVWNVADGRALLTITTGHGNVYAMAFAPDRRTLATTGWDGTISLWSLATGAELWATKAEAVQLRFSSDGKRVIGDRPSGGDPQGEHRVLDVGDGHIVWSGRVHDTSRWPIQIAAIADDGRTSWEIVPIGMHQVSTRMVPSAYAIRAIDLDTGKVTQEIPLADPVPRALALSPAGDRLAVLGQAITVVRVASGKTLASFASRRQEAIGLSSDPDWVITWDRTDVSAWKVATGTETTRVSVHQYSSPRPRLGPEGTLLLVDERDCIAFRLADGAELWRRKDAPSGYATAETRPIAIVQAGSSVFEIVDVRTGKTRLPGPAPSGPPGQISALSVSADGARIAGPTWGQTPWVWDTAASPPSPAIRLIAPPEKLAGASTTFLPDGRLAVSGQVGAVLDSVTVYRYDIDQNAILETEAVAHQNPLRAGVVAGHYLVVGEIDKLHVEHIAVDLTGKAKPRRLHRLILPRGPKDPYEQPVSLYNAVVAPDLSRAYVATTKSIFAWNLASGKLAARADGQRPRVVLMALSADGKHLLACDELGGLALYRARDLVVEQRLLGLTVAPTAAAFSPDGSYVLVAATTGLFVWSASNATLVETVEFTTQRESPSALAFSPDGRILWVGTSLGLLHRFGLDVRGP